MVRTYRVVSFLFSGWSTHFLNFSTGPCGSASSSAPSSPWLPPPDRGSPSAQRGWKMG